LSPKIHTLSFGIEAISARRITRVSARPWIQRKSAPPQTKILSMGGAGKIAGASREKPFHGGFPAFEPPSSCERLMVEKGLRHSFR
jgi:hypothetical protein